MVRIAHSNSCMDGMPKMCGEMAGGSLERCEPLSGPASAVVGPGPSLHFKFALAIAFACLHSQMDTSRAFSYKLALSCYSSRTGDSRWTFDIEVRISDIEILTSILKFCIPYRSFKKGTISGTI